MYNLKWVVSTGRVRVIVRFMDEIEGRARAICEIGLQASGVTAGSELRAAVDRYWPVFAVELKAGVINLDRRSSLANLETALTAYRAWEARRA